MKCNQSRLGFELVSPCPFPTTITITPRASWVSSPGVPVYVQCSFIAIIPRSTLTLNDRACLSILVTQKLFVYNSYIYIYIYIYILVLWIEFSPMARETGLQLQVESYQRLKKWYMIPLCLTHNKGKHLHTSVIVYLSVCLWILFFWTTTVQVLNLVRRSIW